MKNAKEKSVSLIPLLEGSVIEATVFDGGRSLISDIDLLIDFQDNIS